ncbi:hypothetical protein PSHT_02907 [Puccinia striiformis]|uniref:Uncharacterized protein n=1 Tax=Puccinia striiformis TaxID=27350 RepID=A0A2S4WGW0_9BASI|nr:hypothetical protein PSHT_02907 [Puccinia striiformis]
MGALRPATTQELKKFREVRDRICTALARGDLRLKSGDTFDVKSVAKRLDQKLSPPVNRPKRVDEAIPKESEYVDYVKKLQLRQLSLLELQSFRQKWESVELSIDLTPAEKLVRDWVNQSIDTLAKCDVTRFNYNEGYDAECEKVIDSIKPQLEEWQIQSKNRLSVENFRTDFPTIFSDEPSKPRVDLTKFVKAETVHFGKQSAIEESRHPILTVEKVIQNLSTAPRLGSELHNYSIVKGFEKILEKIYQEACRLFMEQLIGPLSLVLAKPLQLKTSLESIFESVKEEDVAWREKLFQDFYVTLANPAMVFEQLKGLPEDEIRIRSALRNHVDFLASLPVKQRNGLQQASSDPSQFAKQLAEIEDHLKNQRANLRLFLNFRTEATILDVPVKRPFVEHLYNQGIIDETTLTKLNPPDGLSRGNYLKALGTQEEFNRGLMKKFQHDLLDALAASKGKQERVVAHTARLLARSQVEQLEIQAKSIYLTPDLFATPPSFKFDKALEIFRPGNIEEIAKSPQDAKMLAKAYIQVCLPMKNSHGGYKSGIDRFLTRIKIPQSGYHSGKQSGPTFLKDFISSSQLINRGFIFPRQS